jgi:hypothetical protein
MLPLFLDSDSRMEPQPNRPLMVSDYLNIFKNKLMRYFSGPDPNANNDYFLMTDYISRDNKRRVVFHVSHGLPEHATTYTEVIYVLPVSEEAAPLFKGDDVMPHVEPTFFDVDVPRGSTAEQTIQARGGNITPWYDDIQRLQGLATAEQDAKRKRAIKNVLAYWRPMRSRFLDAIYAAGIRVLRTSSGKNRTSSNPRFFKRPARIASGSNVGSVRSSSSGHRTTRKAISPFRRFSSHRSTSHRSTNRRSTSNPKTPRSTDPK